MSARVRNAADGAMDSSSRSAAAVAGTAETRRRPATARPAEEPTCTRERRNSRATQPAAGDR
jgi:hypothetical protein